MSSPTRCRGVTLVELIVTIVVVATAVSAVLAVTSVTAAHSADNLLQTQAVVIAESYLNEILAKPPGNDCAPTCTRARMDEVGDYNGLVDSGVHDQTGAPVPPLAAYTVSVTVANSTLGTPTAVPAELVTVTVTAPNGRTIALSGYRTQYP